MFGGLIQACAGTALTKYINLVSGLGLGIKLESFYVQVAVPGGGISKGGDVLHPLQN